MAALTLAEVRAALQAGQPETLTTAGTGFAGAQTLLGELIVDIPRAADQATGGANPPWGGPAAQAFRAVIKNFIGFLGDVEPLLDPYQPQLNAGASALLTAKSTVDGITVADLADPAAVAAADLAAAAALETLTLEYQQILQQLGPIASTPEELVTINARDGQVVDPNGEQPIVTHLAGAVLTLPSARLPDLIPNPRLSLLGGPDSGLNLGTNLHSASLHGGTGLPGLGGPPGTVPQGTVGGPRLYSVDNPATQLTTTRRIAGLGAQETVPGQPARMSAPAGQMLGRGITIQPQDEEASEREVTLVGDEDWTDGRGLSEALGRSPIATETIVP